MADLRENVGKKTLVGPSSVSQLRSGISWFRRRCMSSPYDDDDDDVLVGLRAPVPILKRVVADLLCGNMDACGNARSSSALFRGIRNGRNFSKLIAQRDIQHSSSS